MVQMRRGWVLVRKPATISQPVDLATSLDQVYEVVSATDVRVEAGMLVLLYDGAPKAQATAQDDVFAVRDEDIIAVAPAPPAQPAP